MKHAGVRILDEMPTQLNSGNARAWKMRWRQVSPLTGHTQA